MIVGLVLRLSTYSLFCIRDFIYVKLLFTAREGESLRGYDHVRTLMTRAFSVHMRVQKNEKDGVLVGFLECSRDGSIASTQHFDASHS